MCLGVVKSVGPGLAETLNKELDEEEAMYKNVRQSEINNLKAAIDAEKVAQVNGGKGTLILDQDLN